MYNVVLRVNSFRTIGAKPPNNDIGLKSKYDFIKLIQTSRRVTWENFVMEDQTNYESDEDSLDSRLANRHRLAVNVNVLPSAPRLFQRSSPMQPRNQEVFNPPTKNKDCSNQMPCDDEWSKLFETVTSITQNVVSEASQDLKNLSPYNRK